MWELLKVNIVVIAGGEVRRAVYLQFTGIKDIQAATCTWFFGINLDYLPTHRSNLCPSIKQNKKCRDFYN